MREAVLLVVAIEGREVVDVERALRPIAASGGSFRIDGKGYVRDDGALVFDTGNPWLVAWAVNRLEGFQRDAMGIRRCWVRRGDVRLEEAS